MVMSEIWEAKSHKQTPLCCISCLNISLIFFILFHPQISFKHLFFFSHSRQSNFNRVTKVIHLKSIGRMNRLNKCNSFDNIFVPYYLFTITLIYYFWRSPTLEVAGAMFHIFWFHVPTIITCTFFVWLSLRFCSLNFDEAP